MFEIKEMESEVQMIGTFVDVYEFAERWSKFSTFQKAALKSNSYIGTLDEFSLNVGYSAPMGTIYRRQMVELQEMGLITVMDFNQEYYDSHKSDFDNYDYEKNKNRKWLKSVKMFVIPSPAELTNILLEVSADKFPDHSGTGPAVRKNCDLREINNQKRRERRKK